MAGLGVFQTVGGARPKRSLFDLSYERKFTADFSILYPVMCDECVPGDSFKIGASHVIRFNPLVAPIMHEVTAKAYYFFVPYRILDDDWEEIITGGVLGNSTKEVPWHYVGFNTNASSYDTLWDLLGYPTDPGSAFAISNKYQAPWPMDYPRRAYYGIWVEYFMDQNLYGIGSPLPFVDYDNLRPIYSAFGYAGAAQDYNEVRQAAWAKDYFTSALPWQERGVTPAIPISGSAPVSFSFANDPRAVGFQSDDASINDPAISIRLANSSDPAQVLLSAPGHTSSGNRSGLFYWNPNQLAGRVTGSANLSSAITFTVSDLRTAFQIQKWLERNARGGVRYTEFLRAHFACSPRDERLDRPEFIGSVSSKIITSEVLQTSSTDSTSPQANMAGHGISVAGSYVGTYHVQEYGLIMGLLTIRPKPAYQQRIDRQWLRRNRYDFFFPEFQHLSEQGVFQAELSFSGSPSNRAAIFGFQGRYNEMRFKHDMVSGLFRQSRPGNFSFWHMARYFSGSPFNDPTFLTSGFNDASGAKRVLAVPSQPAFLVNWCNHVKAARPMPYIADPGLIDHF